MPSPDISVRLTGVTFTCDGIVPVLSDISLHLLPGWTGLVGPNTVIDL